MWSHNFQYYAPKKQALFDAAENKVIWQYDFERPL